ncbi:MAG: DUF5666 domain-containing protein [Gammaproteobacteria bacterium]|nr:DUF5666 domain-containing protein [Gammaproteobacteria bacterium]
MNNWPVWKKSIASIFLGLMVSSCAPTLVATGGIGGTGISWGAVTAFGSVYVNGVHYDTTQLESESPQNIWLDGQRGNYSQLKVGMVLRVYGSINADGLNGIATGLEYKSLAKGPAYSFNDNMDGTGSFTMFGQTVYVNNNTLFDDRRSGGLVANITTLAGEGENALYLEISGYQAPAPDNNIYAHRIEVKRNWVNGDSVRLMGTVGSIISGSSFTIGSQAIVYDSATDNLNGKYVEVEGTYSGSTFVADMVTEDELGVNGNDGEEFELEGVVTTVPDVNERFTLNGQIVQIVSAGGIPTEFVGGTAVNLSVSTEVEVEGEFNASGILVAEQIEFDNKGTEIQATGNIDTSGIDNGARTLMIGGGLYYVVADTEIRDERSIGRLEQFSFINFADGMNLDFRYYVETGSGNSILTRVDVID